MAKKSLNIFVATVIVLALIILGILVGYSFGKNRVEISSKENATYIEDAHNILENYSGIFYSEDETITQRLNDNQIDKKYKHMLDSADSISTEQGIYQMWNSAYRLQYETIYSDLMKYLMADGSDEALLLIEALKEFDALRSSPQVLSGLIFAGEEYYSGHGTSHTIDAMEKELNFVRCQTMMLLELAEIIEIDEDT